MTGSAGGPRLVDSHAHLDDERFSGDRAEMIQRAWDSGVHRILTIGNGKGPADMGCGIALAEKHDWIYTTAGIHPHDAARATDEHFTMMERLAAHPRVLAIGETGLDYHYDNSPRDVQRLVFRRQLELASRVDLPVIIHTREADEDTRRILRECRPRRGILHCFTSTAEMAEFAISSGLTISFSGIVTFPSARTLAEIAREVPPDRYLVETDCPYLAPVPYRGRRNEPAFLLETARFLADARGIHLDQLAGETSANFARLFSLPETS